MRRPPLTPEEKELGGFTQQLHEEGRGVEKLLDFVEKAKEVLGSPEGFIKLLQLSPQEILATLERVNGILLHKPLHNRNAFSFEGVQTLGVGEDIDFTFPSNQSRLKIFTDYSELTAKLLAGKELSLDAVSMYVFNLIIYLHPFVDGNGRTARFCSLMLRQNKNNDYDELQALQKTIEERNYKVNEDFHYQMNQLGYKWLLYKRGIEDADGNSKIEIDNVDVFATLETSQLFFMACYDAMSSEERTQYNRSLETGTFLFKASELPKDIKDRAREKMESIRGEFIRKVLDISLGVYEGAVDENVTPGWLKDLFKEVVK